jgi:hypothetical protein
MHLFMSSISVQTLHGLCRLLPFVPMCFYYNANCFGMQAIGVSRFHKLARNTKNPRRTMRRRVSMG